MKNENAVTFLAELVGGNTLTVPLPGGTTVEVDLSTITATGARFLLYRGIVRQCTDRAGGKTLTKSERVDRATKAFAKAAAGEIHIKGLEAPKTSMADTIREAIRYANKMGARTPMACRDEAGLREWWKANDTPKGLRVDTVLTKGKKIANAIAMAREA